jgi:hypothetical protein
VLRPASLGEELRSIIMGDIISIQRGAAPWAPSADAEVVAEYRYYDVPVEGIVRQHGVEFLFACLTGGIDPVSFWIYARVTPEERARLESAADPSSYVELMRGHGFHAPYVLALAVEDVGILASAVVDDDEHLQEAMRSLHRYMQSLAEDTKELADA